MSESSVPLVPAELAGMVIETLLFGAYLVVFSGSCYVIFSAGFSGQFARGPLNLAMIFACFMLFASIVAHWVIDVVRLFDAFIYGHRGSPLAFYAFLSDGKNVAKTALYILECLLADSIMVLRLYYVWGKNWKIALFPISTTCAFVVTGIGICYQFAIIQPGVQVFVSDCGRWILSCFTLTLATNLYSTTLIAYKLWSTMHSLQTFKVSPNTRLRLPRVLHIVVESAAVYSACTLTTFICYIVQSNAQFPGLDSTSPVIGLVFCLIIVRVHLVGHSIREQTKSMDTNPSFQMRTLAINVNQQVQSRLDIPVAPAPKSDHRISIEDKVFADSQSL
ncbi:hypothetical protein ONZ45_g10993 [Pleurotus djamor]|nr:hypothetical protein ONZ45_g11012 [Pleurotus djamor]KAJ8503288.1 hypothetical protein ONZ45_g10993 [Pleurotus djamor]